MLEHVKVDGFRSLINFSITLALGVNVIVGANGTGKTNFVSFLDFLGEMVGNDLNAAIAVSQGAGSVFSKEKFQSDRAELTFDLTGVFDTDLLANKDFYFGNAGGRQSGSYTYSTRITYLRNVPTILIAFEELQLRVVDQGSLSLRRTTEHGTEGFLTHLEFSPRDHPLIKAVLGWDREVKEGRRNASEMMAARLSPNRSFLIEFIGEIAAISSVVSDLTGLRSVNIDPSLARKPTPVGVTQDIGSRGEGLAGALFRLSSLF